MKGKSMAIETKVEQIAKSLTEKIENLLVNQSTMLGALHLVTLPKVKRLLESALTCYGAELEAEVDEQAGVVLQGMIAVQGLRDKLSAIWALAAKAQAMRDVPNEHERRLYEAIEHARPAMSPAALSSRLTHKEQDSKTLDNETPTT